VGRGEGKVGAQVPTAQELKRRGRGLRPCNIESAEGYGKHDRQIDRQTNYLRITVR